jgi:hypothetical protein
MFSRQDPKLNTNTNFYIKTDPLLGKLFKQASTLFKTDIESAIKIAESAVNYAQDKLSASRPDNIENAQKDLAHCLRKYATFTIRSKNIPLEKTKQALSLSIEYFEKIKKMDEILLAEKRCSLDLLRKVAFDLEDGPLLESIAKKAIAASGSKKDVFFSNALEAMEHVAFARGNYPEALAYCNQVKQLLDENKLDTSTIYRHKSKIALAVLENTAMPPAQQKKYFSEEVEDVFFECLDGHVMNGLYALTTYQQAEFTILKDLMFLFNIYCKKSLMILAEGKTILPEQTPKELVLKEACRLFSTNNFEVHKNPAISPDGVNSFVYKAVAKKLEQKIQEIRRTQRVALDYAFFPEHVPPSIFIPKEAMQDLFPDYSLKKAYAPVNSFSL